MRQYGLSSEQNMVRKFALEKIATRAREINARVRQIIAGTNQIQRNIIGRHVVKTY